MATFLLVRQDRPGCTICAGVATYSVAFDRWGQTAHLGWVCNEHAQAHIIFATCFCDGPHTGTQQKNGHRYYCPLHPDTPEQLQQFPI